MTTYKVNQGQNLFDVALQCYGDSAYIVQLCLDNGLSLDDDLVGQQLLLFDDTVFHQNTSTLYLALNSTSIVSADLEADNGLLEHTIQEHTVQEHN